MGLYILLAEAFCTLCTTGWDAGVEGWAPGLAQGICVAWLATLIFSPDPETSTSSADPCQVKLCPCLLCSWLECNWFVGIASDCPGSWTHTPREGRTLDIPFLTVRNPSKYGDKEMKTPPLVH